MAARKGRLCRAIIPFETQLRIKKNHVQYCRLISCIFVRMNGISSESYTFALLNYKSLTVSMNLNFARENGNKFSGSR